MAIALTLSLAATTLAATASDSPAMGRHRPVSQATAYNWAAAGTLGTALAGTALAAFGGGSGGATNLGVSLILVGLGVGPSAGQFYAGSYAHGIAATTLRGLGAVMAVAGAAQSVHGTWGCVREDDPCRPGGGSLALMTGGTLIYFGGVAYSLVDTRFAVRRKNSGSRVSLAPSLGATPRGDLQPGLHAQVRF